MGAVAVLGTLASFMACGESRKAAPHVAVAAGHAGEAGEEPEPEAIDAVRCGAATCRAIGDVPPCCANPRDGICGVELGMAPDGPASMTTCQPVTEPGKLDPGCPPSIGGVVGGLPLPPFPGCCREATGQCGYLVSDLAGLLPFAPGCIDATPFLGGEAAESCGSGANTGGATGAGGGQNAEGGASTGGAISGEEAGSGGHGGVPGAVGEAGAPTMPGSAGEGGLGGNGSAT
jgi:hypothetical protein